MYSKLHPRTIRGQPCTRRSRVSLTQVPIGGMLAMDSKQRSVGARILQRAPNTPR